MLLLNISVSDYYTPSSHHHHSHPSHHHHHHQKPLESTGAALYGFSSSYSNSTLGAPHHVAAMFLQNSSAAPAALNPIDRLYSMQNSYFCSEDSNLAPQWRNVGVRLEFIFSFTLKTSKESNWNLYFLLQWRHQRSQIGIYIFVHNDVINVGVGLEFIFLFTMT